MDDGGFQRWLNAYVEAWQTYDPAAIGDLFSVDVEYRYHPWDEPVRGREALVEAWLDDRDEPDSWAAEYRPWLVAGDDAVAVGVSRYRLADEAGREYHNVFLCRFDGDGRCREFTEHFMQRKKA
ncbi:MAG: nuclear transport factor 2 family protein [Gaiellaceae bacterium]